MAAVRRISTFPYHHISFLFLSLSLILQCLPLSLSYSLSIGGEGKILFKFKESLKNTIALDETWIKGRNPCDKNRKWFGVQCNRNTITGLHLYNLGLKGDIDVEALSKLQGLRMIAMANNSFSGEIPDFNKLVNLRSLFIHGNNFSGKISANYFAKMESLRKLWLSNNNFSGRIPVSLGNCSNLIELRLDGNRFSDTIPSLPQKSLMNFDVSRNRLQGEIPYSLVKFWPKAFRENPRLCGARVGTLCPGVVYQFRGHRFHGAGLLEPLHIPDPHGQGAKWGILTAVTTFLLVTIMYNKNQDEVDTLKAQRKENLDESVPGPRPGHVHVDVPSLAKNQSSSNKGGNESLRSSSGTSRADFVVVNDDKGVFGLSDLMRASAEVLGNGGLGSAYKAALSNGLTVVVKRLKETNKMSKDSFDAEIRKLGKLRHHNILPPLAYHYRSEEKLLVSEYAPKGSLLFLLHGDRGECHKDLNWATRLKIIQGIASGMEFLHTEFPTYEVPHGNLKSSNILLTSTYDPLLTDYGFHPLVNNTHTTLQTLFSLKAPEGQRQQICPKSDVYCLGVVILEIVTGKFPSQYLGNPKGGTDVVEWTRQAVSGARETEVIDPEIIDADSVEHIVKMVKIGVECTESEVDKRPNMKEAITRIRDIQIQD